MSKPKWPEPERIAMEEEAIRELLRAGDGQRAVSYTANVLLLAAAGHRDRLLARGILADTDLAVRLFAGAVAWHEYDPGQIEGLAGKPAPALVVARFDRGLEDAARQAARAKGAL